MKNLNKILKVTFIFLIVYILIFLILLYVRPDINYLDFIFNKRYIFIHLCVLFLILNYNKIFIFLFNKILFISIFISSSYVFFPGFFQAIQNSIENKFVNTFSDSEINNLLTPKDGSKSILKSENRTLKFSPENRNVEELFNNIKQINKNKITSTNLSSNNIKNEDIENKINNLSKEDISFIANQPLAYISKLTELAPKEIKNKLNNLGINVQTPQDTIKNLVGIDHNKQKNIIIQLLK